MLEKLDQDKVLRKTLNIYFYVLKSIDRRFADGENPPHEFFILKEKLRNLIEERLKSVFQLPVSRDMCFPSPESDFWKSDKRIVWDFAERYGNCIEVIYLDFGNGIQENELVCEWVD